MAEQNSRTEPREKTVADQQRGRSLEERKEQQREHRRQKRENETPEERERRLDNRRKRDRERRRTAKQANSLQNTVPGSFQADGVVLMDEEPKPKKPRRVPDVSEPKIRVNNDTPLPKPLLGLNPQASLEKSIDQAIFKRTPCTPLGQQLVQQYQASGNEEDQQQVKKKLIELRAPIQQLFATHKQHNLASSAISSQIVPSTTTIQTASRGIPTTIQTASGGIPTTIQTASRGIPTTIQTASGGIPTTIQAASGGIPTTIQAASGGIPHKGTVDFSTGIEAITRDREEMKAKVEEKDKQIKEYRRKLNASKTEISNLKSECETQTKELHRLRNDHETEVARLSRSKDKEIGNLRASLENKIKEQKKQLEKWTNWYRVASDFGTITEI